MKDPKEKTITEHIAGLKEMIEWEKAYVDCIISGQCFSGRSVEERAKEVAESNTEISIAVAEIKVMEAIA